MELREGDVSTFYVFRDLWNSHCRLGRGAAPPHATSVVCGDALNSEVFPEL